MFVRMVGERGTFNGRIIPYIVAMFERIVATNSEMPVNAKLTSMVNFKKQLAIAWYGTGCPKLDSMSGTITTTVCTWPLLQLSCNMYVQMLLK